METLLLMSNMVTRCPKCATSFRITSAQLQSAKGAVRCGSCLHIFKAQDHLVSSETPVANASSQARAAARVTPPVAQRTSPTPVTTNSNRPADLAARKVASNIRTETNRSQPATPAKPAMRAAGPKTSPETASAATKTVVASAPKMDDVKPATASAPVIKTSPPPTAKHNIQPSDKSDKHKLAFDQDLINRELLLSGDDDFLISDDMDETPEKKAKDSDYEFDGFLEIEKLPAQSISLFDREARIEEPEETDNTDESWAMDLLDDADEDTKFSSAKDETEKKDNKAEKESKERDEFESYSNSHALSHSPQEEHEKPRPTPGRTHFGGHVFSLIGEKSISDSEPTEEIQAQPYSENSLYQQAMIDAKDDSRMRAYDTSRAALLMNIMPEPVVMTSRRKANWAHKKLWVGLSALMVIVLLVQTAWLQFNNLNRIEPYRSAYELICSIAGCKLPPLVDHSKIRAYNLVVRNHPSANDALMVDAIILNNANFQQPFPDLVLAFSTIDDKPVAARRFTPKEYLGGELAGQHLMPQNQPIHLTLELVDPGPAAVNYHAYIPE